MALKGTVAKAMLKRFPNTPTMTLAKKLYKENPELFTDLEDARGRLRYYNGTTGVASRVCASDKSIFKKIKVAQDTNPFKLPESSTTPRDVWRLPKANKKVLLLSDLHFPFQDNEAITLALNYGKEQKVDTIFINGDMLDFFSLSFHEKDPRKIDLALELEMGRQFFQSLRDNFPRASIYYIPGNHEKRLERYLVVKAPELLDVAEWRLDVLLKVRDYDVIYLSHGTKCYFGKLLVEHGDKIRGAGGVNPARTLFQRLKRHAICGHFHRTTEATEKIYDGDVVVSYSTGCLCELEPHYMEVNNHNHGFAIVEVNNSLFTVYNKKIVNGKIY